MSTEIDFPKDDIDFNGSWSSLAGELRGLQFCISVIETRAAAAFISKDDKLANALRGIHSTLIDHANHKSKELDGYIKESSKRNHT